MSAIQLSEHLYSVGVLNPSLRVFDIVMTSPYGTSYNAYLLTGEKNILIETVHADYWEEYRANIESVVPLEEIDYLVMNHNEPDHSGSVGRLLSMCPKLKVLCTQAGKKHLADITNADVPCQVVRAGDILDLGGGRTLEFFPSPMLHWADSMFTWAGADKALFTCDFLGAHFCEPTMLDTKVHDPQAYLGQVEHYYNCIFGPFKPHVLAGLDKLSGLDPAIVCPSHGPCLTGTRIGELQALYRDWSTPRPREKKLAAVLYCSAYGCTERLARAAAEALEAEGLEVALRDVTFTSLSEMAALANDCDLLAVGAPTINRDAPKAIWDVLSSIDAVNSAGKPALVFASYGWSGEGGEMLRTRLAQLRFAVPDAAYRVLFTPTDADLDAVRAAAKEAAAKLN